MVEVGTSFAPASKFVLIISPMPSSYSTGAGLRGSVPFTL